MQTEESRKNVAAGIFVRLYNMLDNYRTCKQSEGYKKELSNVLSDIQKTDNLYSQRESRMEAFMKDYNQRPQEEIPSIESQPEELQPVQETQQEQYVQDFQQDSYPQQQPITNN